MRREHIVRVRLDDAELAALDAAAAAARLSRPRLLRKLILNGPGEDDSAPGRLTRAEALELLEESARAGSVIAQVGLVRELRLQPLSKVAQPATGPVTVEELRRELRVVR